MHAMIGQCATCASLSRVGPPLYRVNTVSHTSPVHEGKGEGRWPIAMARLPAARSRHMGVCWVHGRMSACVHCPWAHVCVVRVCMGAWVNDHPERVSHGGFVRWSSPYEESQYRLT